ncbi:MAG TPA: MBL fold metallo-hydrolase [Myxococcales bacterium]|jgi:glyoxylase-like metal-dependent hydrolase (beta-lactamase superfamily II)|nr:MBL fold metallo-hydrolase [Myxococcales bacterium]
MYVRQLKLGPMENFVYLIGADDAAETAIIDAAWDVDAALRAAEEDGRRVTDALVSHHHFDHVNGLPALLAARGVRVHAHAADVPKLAPELQGEVTAVRGGDLVEVGPMRIRALHTPGHTPGSTCWQVEGREGGLFSGDTVFVGACGRCDLAGGDPEEMYQSLRRISELDPALKLYPGHDYGDVPVSSVAREREKNPYFSLLGSLPDFVAYRMRPRR